MLSKDAIAYYGSVPAVAAELGLTRQAVGKWGEVVPLESALALEIRTGRALRVDRTLYPPLARALDAAEQSSEQRATA
jgi:hypothetical protein